MSHTISIKNLGPIKEINNFEIKKINAVIGGNGSGKSLLAKAIFYFNSGELIDYLFDFNNRYRSAYAYFNIEKFFPAYQDYTIHYNYTKDLSVTVTHSNQDINIETSAQFKEKIAKFSEEKGITTIDDITEEIDETIEHLKKIAIEKTAIEEIEKKYKKLRVHIKDQCAIDFEDLDKARNEFLKEFNMLPIVFIPATRSFVSDFDELRLRSAHRSALARRRNRHDQLNSDITLSFFSETYRQHLRFFKKLDKKYHPIMQGKVIKKPTSGKLAFITNGQTLDITEISSGQKELFPILLILQGILNAKQEKLIIIEEPESHLFPENQKAILDLIVEVANFTNSKIFINTHSPYILMSINNLLEAKNRNFKKLESKFIDFQQVTIEKLENGKTASVLDTEEELVDTEYIDEITTTLVDEFNKILDSEK